MSAYFPLCRGHLGHLGHMDMNAIRKGAHTCAQESRKQVSVGVRCPPAHTISVTVDRVRSAASSSHQIGSQRIDITVSRSPKLLNCLGPSWTKSPGVIQTPKINQLVILQNVNV